jgi:hypothetical protein
MNGWMDHMGGCMPSSPDRQAYVMLMSVSPFGHKAVGALFRRCEKFSHQSPYVVKTTYPYVTK